MATLVKLDDELKGGTQQLADGRHRSAHWTMRDYVEREETREDFKQEALAFWTSDKETGLHLTGKAVRDWLSSRGTDKETTIPRCHK